MSVKCIAIVHQVNVIKQCDRQQVVLCIRSIQLCEVEVGFSRTWQQFSTDATVTCVTDCRN